ncbi:GntR family transcriptional regulator [Erwinia sp. ErVv1]|uniref:GntR family transcriptional regulator n=1 Tax=Erwinia sp. ErVv1 TaxID=1603299 RepID=UPI0008344252|nr:GntR family transcriptional regulator [Erwinia sp. ErVv1]
MKSDSGFETAPEQQDKDEFIYQALMSAMVEHQLPPGSKLPEEALSEVFGVSRTGIRQVLQRLAAVQMIVLTPRRGAQVALPSAEEAKEILHTRSLIECANLPEVVERCQSTHLVALEKINHAEQQAHKDRDGPAAIRLSADFHINLQAISGNQVLTDMVTRLTQRSSLVIAAWGAPWQQGCRCDDHDRLIELMRKKALAPLTDALQQHFAHILASLRFAPAGEATLDFAKIFSAKGEK